MMMEAKKHFVRLVNPKFLSFNRPVIIAFIVGSVTLAFSVYIFATLQFATETKSYTGYLENVMNVPRVDCVHYISYLMADNSQRALSSTKLDDPKVVVRGTVCNPSTMSADTLKRFPGIATELCMDDSAFLSFINPDTKKARTAKEIYSMATTVPCDEAFHYNTDGTKNSDNEGKLVTMSYEEEADIKVTIGVALGYVGLIELLTTLIVVGIGIKVKLLSTTDDKFLNDLFAQANKEIGGEVKGKVKDTVKDETGL